MKQRLLFYALLFFLSVQLTACQQELGPYKEVTQTYPLANFDRLDMGSAFHIDVRSGSSFEVAVRGNEADVNDLDLRVRNGTLHAEYRGTSRRKRYDMYVTVTMPTLREIKLSGAAQSTITGFTSSSVVNASLSGASNVTINLAGSRLTSELSGASTIHVVGTSDGLTSNLSGASKLDAFDCLAKQAQLDLSGASTARVRVQEELTVKASGASTVRYQGSPQTHIELSGSSTAAKE
ncbi:head GIN domain-containing protein [Spirosoma oryzicola]|uniref:head GIN domain-containing protein n=1 Tax=Spirosoma oryzicola TaxID=2898794 RepID=UPI001E6298B0|nr:head GIN domain-containing protein [Spirosoma oryzicola]UHG92732.1 DUF2807 domain-containing protein [Spirosoma oryzicola]